MVNLIDELDAN